MNIHDFSKKFILNDKIKNIDSYLGLRLSEFLREEENLKGSALRRIKPWMWRRNAAAAKTSKTSLQTLPLQP